MSLKVFAPSITDGYKLGHPEQYTVGTELVAANMTPRSDRLARVLERYKTGKIVFLGLQYALKEYLVDTWNETFFNQPKDKVVAKFARRVRNYLGKGHGDFIIEKMAALHDLGYLPVRIKSLPEGSRVNMKVPFFTVRNTHKDFYWVTNYIETLLSAVVWPFCNAASVSEQYYKLSKHYGTLTGANLDQWLGIANHNFSARGCRGVEDMIITAAGHSLFGVGSDTLAVIDFFEDYYNANSDNECIAVSVNASEHATVTQKIALYNGNEKAALKEFITQIYPKGIFSYVSDSIDYFDVIARISLELKEEILARGPDENGLPGKVVFRPDSSKKTPLEIICGDLFLSLDDADDLEDAKEFAEEILVDRVGEETPHGEPGDTEAEQVFLFQGKYYKAVVEIEWNRHDKRFYYIDGSKLTSFEEVQLTPEEKGTLQLLWENFGGEYVTGSNGKQYKLLDSHVGVIYGEAISLEMAEKIYQRMEEQGWCVQNVLFGVGSWAFIDRSSRDTYSIAVKATYSEVVDEDGVRHAVEQQKTPKTSSGKESAKGLLRVEQEGDDFVLYDQQTWEQEEQGALMLVFENSKTFNETSLVEIRKRISEGL